jgi:major intracellular serine protease
MQNSWFINEIYPLWNLSKGSGCRIYVLDTGCPTHQILSNINNIFKSEIDTNGHATHISGILLQIAPDCEIVPIKITDGASPSIPLIISALKHILSLVKDNRRDVINMSISYSANDKAIYKLIKKLYNENVPIVCASGNTNGKDSWYPAKLKETIAVGSYNSEYQISAFSSNDEVVDFFAPGENIYSTALCDEFTTMSGTSQACPYVAGIVALLLTSIAKNATIPSLVSHLKKYSIPISQDKIRISPVSVLNNPIIPVDNMPVPWYIRLINLFKKGFL